MASPPSVLNLNPTAVSSLPEFCCWQPVQEISLPPFWNPGSEDLVSTERTPEITGDIRQPRLVWRRPPRLAWPLTSSLRSPLFPPAGAPNCRCEKEVSLFPRPRQSNRPLQHRRNYHHRRLCLCLSLLFTPLSWVGSPVCTSVPSQSSPPASPSGPVSHFSSTRRVPSLSARLSSTVRQHSRSIRTHQRWAPPALPCLRACARNACMHAQHGSSLKTPQRPPPGPSHMAQQRSRVSISFTASGLLHILHIVHIVIPRI